MRKLKKLLPIIAIIAILTMLIVLFVNVHISDASAGFTHSYSSGGGSSSHSSSSHSSYSSSSHSSSSYSGSGSSSSGGGSIGGLVVFIIIVAIIILTSRKGKNVGDIMSSIPTVQSQSEAEIEAKIKETDPMFNKEEFNSMARDLFVKLQKNWMARDWSELRVFETNELFEQHKNQLQELIDKGQINVMERICVLSSELMSFEQSGDKDILSVRLKSRMVDYIIDEKTEKIVAGDKSKEIYSTHKLTFIRKTGVKTKEGTDKVNTTNCPNCGAPTQITSAGKCKYCGSVITTGEFSWVLSELTILSQD